MIKIKLKNNKKKMYVSNHVMCHKHFLNILSYGSIFLTKLDEKGINLLKKEIKGLAYSFLST